PLRPTLFPYTTLFRSRNQVGEREPHALALALHVGVHLVALLALAERLDGEAEPLLARVHIGHLGLDHVAELEEGGRLVDPLVGEDRKSTRLNSSHVAI